MSYMVVAEVNTGEELNQAIGDRTAIPPGLRVLSERDGIITFCISGEFGEEKERTASMCKALIDAGYVSFSIRHSY